MADYPTVELVPGDFWRELVQVRNADGSAPDYSAFTAKEAKIVYPGGDFDISVDLSDAANGNFTLTAAETDTPVVPIGSVSSVYLQLESASGEDETPFWAHVKGVKTRSVTEVTVYTLGAPGFPTNVTVSTSSPTGGSDGELWFQVPSS